MIYSDVEAFLSAGLSLDPMPTFSPGPASDMMIQKVSPDAVIFIMVGGGAGFNNEQLFQAPTIAIRSIGPQGDYNAAEAQALAIDALMCSINSNATVGTAPVTYMSRLGGQPLLIEHDNADRYHFACSYIADTQTGW